MQTFLLIIGANMASTAASLSLAAALGFRFLSGLVERLVHVSIGLLLATGLMHLLPEAVERGIAPSRLGWTLLLGILALFVLEKATLIHHTHHHEGDPHHHEHGHDAKEAGRGAYPVLVGDAFHNFGDGVVIAASFLVDVHAGLLTSMAVMAHEIPHEIGDFMILLNAGFSRGRAFGFMLISGSSAVLGGAIGYFVLARLQAMMPYALALAAASFVYIALSDLLPELMRRSSLRRTLPDVGLVLLGVVIAVFAASLEPD